MSGWYDDGSEEQHQMEQQRLRAVRAVADEEAKRVRSIALDVALHKAAILNAVDEIARMQVGCEHEFNHWILGGWPDHSDVRVCPKCGKFERRSAQTVGTEP